MRQIVLDTETTGLSFENGDRIIEIGCLELWNRIPTGRFYKSYINPERDIPEKATQITGLTEAFLKTFKPFSFYVCDFLDFIQDSPLIIHNAKFDIGFLNFELQQLGKEPLPLSRAIDTLIIARKKFPGSPASLDALAKRFNISIPREKHGAFLDAQILAEVYIELTGGRQRTFEIKDQLSFGQDNLLPLKPQKPSTFPYRSFPLSEEDTQAFHAMLLKIKNPLWNHFMEF